MLEGREYTNFGIGFPSVWILYSSDLIYWCILYFIIHQCLKLFPLINREGMTQTCHARAASSQTPATILSTLLNGWPMEACCATSAKDFVLVASPYNFCRGTEGWQLEQRKKRLKNKLQSPRLQQRKKDRHDCSPDNQCANSVEGGRSCLVWLGWVQDPVAMVKNRP
jgi:hypothetical protein